MQVWSKMDFGTGEIIFLDITQKEDMLQVELFRTAFCWIWAGIRTDTSFLSFKILIGRIQSSSMKQQKGISFPKLLTEAVRLVEKESQSAGAN